MPRIAESERDARELLARWSALSVLEPLQHGPSSASTVRIEPAHLLPQEDGRTEHIPSNLLTQPMDTLATERPRRHKRRRRDATAADVVRLRSESDVAPAVKFSWSQLAGHLAAYGGVGLLSVGMTLVIWSYFGGPSAYAPTGWLLTTVGQMLLYLGVVTLVASGLEQTTDAVTLQMRQMGDKLERLETASIRKSRPMRDAA